MKFGVREICDVVLRAKAAQKIGNKVFYKNEPVLYFDSLKTSTLEGAATTVYAQGGRGNARLIAWEGERTVTFTMEDALISPMGFSVLTGAGLVDASEKPMIVHKTEQVQVATVANDNSKVTILVSEQPYVGDAAQTTTEDTYSRVAEDATYDATVTYYRSSGSATNPIYTARNDITAENFDENKSTLYIKTTTTTTSGADDNEDYIYVMRLDDNGEVDSEPYIASEVSITPKDGKYEITLLAADSGASDINTIKVDGTSATNNRVNDLSKFTANTVVLVDYYVERSSGAFQVDITPDKFGGNFYLEASTLFRATNGVDMPAEFIIPNCKIQSNFTFTMASSGDPSTFTFTMDAFPDYTRWDRTKKVFAAIQVLEESDTLADFERLGTPHGQNSAYNTDQKPWIEI